jgi:hypothetical protein
MKNLKKRDSSHEDHFPKILFTLSHCRIIEDDGFRDLLSRLWMHIDEQDEIALVAQQRRRQKPRGVGGSWLFIVTHSVAATCIYMEDPPRVTVSPNRLGLSLSKRNTHGLIAKINDKRKLRTCEALGRILTDHSRAHQAPVPIASPGPGRRGEQVRMCFSLSPLLHTCKFIKSNSPFK